MAIKLADTLAPMADFPAAMAEHIEFSDGENLQEKLDAGSLGSGGGASYTELTQEEYDALTEEEKVNGTEYRTYDTGMIYKYGVQYSKCIDDSIASADTTWSSEKINADLGHVKVLTFGTASATQWLKLTLGNSSKFQPITITDQYGGKVEITGMTNDGTYKSVKLVRYSYGDWTTHSATNYTTTSQGDANYKIRNLYYYPTNGCYYLEIRQWCTIKVSGATTKPEMITSLPAETSAMTLIPESQFASKSDLVTTNKQAQGTTPFNEMYFTESRYRKLTVDLYYGREVTFSVNNLGYEGIISVYSSGDSASACIVKNIGVRGNPQSNISVKWGNFKTAGGSGHYQVDLFIYKVNANNTMVIRPRTLQISTYSKVYTSADFVTSSQAEYEAAEYTAVNEYENINDSSTGNTYSTWSSSKIASEIGAKVTKTQYRGSRSIDISTGGKLTLIYSSEYASQAGCYMLLSNFNTEPLLIELGRNNIGQFSVTATHKSQNVDTITVTVAGDEYSWCVLQF